MSMAEWSHHNPVRIHFGRGCRGALSEVLTDQRGLIVCSPRGRQQFESDHLLSLAIRRAKRLVWMDSVEANPDLDHLQDLISELEGEHLDCVIGFGGGSAIDSAKILALALSPVASQRSLRELLDVSADLPLGVALPLCAIPTTAGTGSEVTPFATVWVHGERRKLSLAGPVVYPHTALVDPDLSDPAPYNVTLSTGLDAINQAAESIWNRNMTPMSEMLAHRALRLGMAALPKLLVDLENSKLRDIMAEVSLLAGLAISQTRTSLCHAISYPLTAHFGVPHGIACAFTMPAVLRHNLSADDGRFLRLASILVPKAEKKMEGLLGCFETLNHELNVAESVQEKVASLENLLTLCDEMFMPGRSDNSLSSVDNKILISILTQSWRAYFDMFKSRFSTTCSEILQVKNHE